MLGAQYIAGVGAADNDSQVPAASSNAQTADNGPLNIDISTMPAFEAAVSTLSVMRNRLMSDIGFIISTLKSKKVMLDFTLNQFVTVKEKVKALDSARLNRMIAACESLDISGNGLLRFPRLGVKYMTNLKSLNLSKNPKMEILKQDFSVLGRVVNEVIFRDSGITLEKLQAIMLLPLLTTLDISDNDLSGILDTKFSYDLFRNLTVLKVRNCNLDKNVFIKLVNLPNLTYLDISHNSEIFVDTPPDKKLVLSLGPKLNFLNISNCKLSQKWLKCLSKRIHKLQELDISNNAGLGSFTEVDNFNNFAKTLTTLNVSATDLTGNGLSMICNSCSEIENLNISGNLELGNCMANHSFRRLKKKISRLTATSIGLNVQGLSKICDLEVLRMLNVSKNPLDGMSRDFSFGEVGNTLNELIMNEVGLTQEGLHAICKNGSITRLELNGNPGLNISKAFSFGNLAGTVTTLSLSGCNLTLNGLESLTKLKSVANLTLNNNGDLGSLVTNRFDWGNMKTTLKTLIFRSSDLRLDGLQSIFNCLNITHLDVSNNALMCHGMKKDIILGPLCSKLEKLHLGNTGLSPEGISALNKLVQLEQLNLSNNVELGKKMAKDISFAGMNKKLNYVDFSGCNIRPVMLPILYRRELSNAYLRFAPASQ